MRDVYIVGVGMTRFFKWLERGIKDLTQESVTEALNDAGLQKNQIEAAWFANSTWGYFEGQDQVRGQVALASLGIHEIPVSNSEGACGGGSQALHGAWLAVASGAYECAMAVGAEKLYNEDKTKSFRAIASGTDVENTKLMTDSWIKRLHDLGIATSAEDVVDQDNMTRSPMMDIYAYMIRWHMKEYGTTQHQLALITSKNHRHGSMNPKAQYQKEMTVEEVLAGKPIVYPLTAPMCAPLGDGSAAAILCSGDFLKRMKSPRPVKVLASVYGTSTPRCFDEPEKGIEVRLSAKAYHLAGVGPEDVSLLEIHDAASYGELKMTEQLGFCKRGEGGPLAESGGTTLGGKIPVNVSGGLIARGHPLAATGIAQIYELTTQLRGEAGKRQVEGARIGMSENGGGQIYFEEASMGIHILEKVLK
ncbi:MAG: thiolase family protein [Deltaproteobacteria bacterium]|nr:thiolase family protein [Deltaproteobacteria bacterium]